MSWSYDINLADDISKVRSMLGDTRLAGHVLEDEEITPVVALATDTREAAAALADMLAARPRLTSNQRKDYRALAKSLRKGAGPLPLSNWVGGIEAGGVLATGASPLFSIGDDDYLGDD